MPIDPAIAIGATLPETEISWTSSDVLLYHLAFGAGDPFTDARELRYAYERDLQVLPTFAVVAPSLRVTEPPRVSYPGIEIDLARVLHGSQRVDVHRPLPVQGEARAVARVANVYDKGSAAVVVTETTVTDLDGRPLWTNTSSIFARGEGGFGGDRGPSGRVEPPAREPDATIITPTLPQQALWYRLLGDRNPLHVDPSFAGRSRVSGADPARSWHLRHRLQGAHRHAARRRRLARARVRRPVRRRRLHCPALSPRQGLVLRRRLVRRSPSPSSGPATSSPEANSAGLVPTGRRRRNDEHSLGCVARSRSDVVRSGDSMNTASPHEHVDRIVDIHVVICSSSRDGVDPVIIALQRPRSHHDTTSPDTVHETLAEMPGNRSKTIHLRVGAKVEFARHLPLRIRATADRSSSSSSTRHSGPMARHS